MPIMSFSEPKAYFHITTKVFFNLLGSHTGHHTHHRIIWKNMYLMPRVRGGDGERVVCDYSQVAGVDGQLLAMELLQKERRQVTGALFR